MTRLSILCSIINLFISDCFPFLLDTKSTIIYLDQTKFLNTTASNKSSYFGFSLILNPGDDLNKPWVQIGAPRGNSPTNSYKNPGTIFRCSIAGLCNHIEVNQDDEVIMKNNSNYHERLDNAWIGAAMDINLKYNRSVVCAPRFKVKPSKFELQLMLGACYWSTLNSEKFHRRIPLLNREKFVYGSPRQTTFFDYGLGECGLAVHMPEYGRELLIGAPGVLNWAGTSILYTDDPYISIIHANIFRDAKVPDMKSVSQVDPFDYFGYAVTSGCFFSKTRMYVSGAPRAEFFFGQIFIYKFLYHHYRDLDVEDMKKGTQFGSYFGAAVAAGDINNDGFDDLFVGAPYYKTSKFNEGRMYLFMGSDQGVLQEPSEGKFIDGLSSNGQFGTTITYLGSMKHSIGSNESKYVAVSAPYEEISGVVYIFKGISNGLNVVPFQRIVGNSIHQNLRGFGISISRPADLDRNGFDDIAIGVHQSGHAVILRSQGIGRLDIDVKDFPPIISADTVKFNITICYQFCCNHAMPPRTITRKLSIDQDLHRASLDSSIRENVKLNASVLEAFCENITIIPITSAPEFFQPLSIEVNTTFKLENVVSNNLIVSDKVEGKDTFCPNCPADNETLTFKTITANIPFDLGCGYQDNPECKLEFESRFNVLGVRNNTLVLGTTNTVELETLVKNKGHTVNRLLIGLSISEALNFKQIPAACYSSRRTLSCPIEKPLKKDHEILRSFKLDVSHIDIKSNTKFVAVYAILRTISNRPNIDTRFVKLNLKKQAN